MGPGGAGKTDLAVRLMDAGAEFVADDQVLVCAEAGGLIARAPDQIAGKIELRGIGILDVPHRSEMNVDLVIDLKPRRDIERMPEPMTREIETVTVRVVELDGFEASAVAKIKLILKGL